MSEKKKRVRGAFRAATFARDGGRCVCCGRPATDAHHITDRNLMPHGGYVPENGISLCSACHELAEEFHLTGEARPGYAPEDLYARIGSSHEAANRASLRLDPDRITMWTLKEEVSVRHRPIIDSGGRPRYGGVEVTVRPTRDLHLVEGENLGGDNPEAVRWLPQLEAGVRDFQARRSQEGRPPASAPPTWFG